MTTVRAMLRRVGKLEAGRASPILSLIGGEEGWAAFEEEMATGVAEGRYDRRDMAVVVAALRRWMAA